ncbi:hypothetical protein [Aquabacterium sp.]|uniref:hypothetical protein n=1 Tax=Aquabacterium sp. TaxID=1872578 RepID=UPI0019883D16|nr:hypothetical protein [Aquabacterium sp.]MBC7701728.1 hypothetical protein [Aquabacterium sp.]
MNTPIKSFQQTASEAADNATQTADGAIKSTQRAANNALDNLADRVHEASDQAAPLIGRLSAQAEALGRKTVDAVREGSKRARLQATNAANSTVSYIKEEPVKSVLIAAAAGAALFAIAKLVSRNRDRT